MQNLTAFPCAPATLPVAEISSFVRHTPLIALLCLAAGGLAFADDAPLEARGPSCGLRAVPAGIIELLDAAGQPVMRLSGLIGAWDTFETAGGTVTRTAPDA
ncbi:MAG: hypothetical protein LBW77_04040, partial [Verrucomicrobiota bacterium]|nr:hypothetical protein [Verrucomicrobiota bacterium]